MPAGRPLKFATPEILQERIDAWLLERQTNDKPLTVSSLAVALDTSRRVLVEYGDKEQYSNAIKRAKALCEAYVEEMMMKKDTFTPGQIFVAKNNYQWVDKTETEHTGNMTVVMPSDLADV